MTNAIATFIKDPDAVLDYAFDWAEWLESAEVISTSTWIVPTGITNNSDTKSDTSTTIWLSGGTVGTTYNLVNRIVTDGGRTDDRTMTIVVKQR